MSKVLAHTLQVGDVIMPPPRELQLWMRRALAEKQLPESALHLTITKIHEGQPDKKGRWLVVTTDQSAAWNATMVKPVVFKFHVRPDTLWKKVS